MKFVDCDDCAVTSRSLDYDDVRLTLTLAPNSGKLQNCHRQTSITGPVLIFIHVKKCRIFCSL